MALNLRSVVLRSRHAWLAPPLSRTRVTPTLTDAIDATKVIGLDRVKLAGFDLIGFTEPQILPSFEQREDARLRHDPEVDRLINIGFTSNRSRRDRKQQEKEQAVILKASRKNPALERAARHYILTIPLDEVTKEWEIQEGPDQMAGAAMHYGVFRDLYGKAYFIPQFPLRIKFPSSEDYVTPVHRGNLISPYEALTAPSVSFQSADDNLWTLLLTNLDGHMQEADAEYVHWFIGNIPGGDVTKGDTIVDYLQPIPLRGTGFHRYVFVLYKQEGPVDFGGFREKFLEGRYLQSRTFRTLDFYRNLQSQLTPTSMAFFTSEWDESVTKCFHETLDQTEPAFTYDHRPDYLEPQQKFPHDKPFNLYLDRYRPKEDMAEEIMKKRFKIISPFAADPPRSKWPGISRYYDGKPLRDLPTWKRMEIRQERLGMGRFKLLHNPLATWPD